MALSSPAIDTTDADAFSAQDLDSGSAAVAVLTPDIGHAGHVLMVGGNVVQTDGHVINVIYCQTDNKLCVDPNGGTNPGTGVLATTDFKIAHRGHVLVHVGYVTDANGNPGDIWYCQDDNAINTDLAPS